MININQWYFWTRSNIWWCRIKAASFLARSGISGFGVIFARLTKPILQNMPFVHDEFSRSRAFTCSRSLLVIRAFAVAMATTELITPPFLLTIWRKFQTFSSIVFNIKRSTTFQGTNFFIGIWPPFLLIKVLFVQCCCLAFSKVKNEDETF